MQKITKTQANATGETDADVYGDDYWMKKLSPAFRWASVDPHGKVIGRYTMLSDAMGMCRRHYALAIGLNRSADVTWWMADDAGYTVKSVSG